MNPMIQNAYKIFATRVCEILNQHRDDPAEVIWLIEEEAEALGFTCGSDDRRSNGGRPELCITD